MTTTASSPSRPSSLPACGPHLPHQRLSRSRQTTNKPSPTCFQLPTPSPGQLTTTMITRSAAAAAVSSESSQTPQTQAGSATTSRKQAAINLLATGLPDSQLQCSNPTPTFLQPKYTLLLPSSLPLWNLAHILARIIIIIIIIDPTYSQTNKTSYSSD